MSDDANHKAQPRGRRGYHHGDLKRALIEAVRALLAHKGPMGFSMAEAARAAGVSPSAPYRHFAAFQTMFGGALDFAAEPALAAAAERAFAALGRAVSAVLASIPEERRPPAMMVATHIATISHGEAALNILGARRSAMSPEEILESAVGVYLRGLGVLGE